jgi:uncharacterized membrane-anchored protein
VTAPDRPSSPSASTLLRPVLGLMAGLGITVLIVFMGVTIATFVAMRGQDSRHYVAPFWTYSAHLVIIALGAAAGGAATARITAGHSAYSVFLLALILLMSALNPVLRHVPPVAGQPEWFALALAIVNPLGALAGGLLTRQADARRRASAV